MTHRKTTRIKTVIICLVCFLIVTCGVFFGVQFFTKTGIFRIPGVVYYDGPFDEATETKLQSIFTEEIDLDKDVHISTYNTFSKDTLAEGEFLYKIYVPVTDFYSLEDNVTAENPEQLFTNDSDSYSLPAGVIIRKFAPIPALPNTDKLPFTA